MFVLFCCCFENFYKSLFELKLMIIAGKQDLKCFSRELSFLKMMMWVYDRSEQLDDLWTSLDLISSFNPPTVGICQLAVLLWVFDWKPFIRS